MSPTAGLPTSSLHDDVRAGIIPTETAPAWPSESTTAALQDDNDLSTKIKVGFGIIPALFIFVVVSLCLVGRRRHPRPAPPKDVRAHVLPTHAADVVALRSLPRPPPRSPSDESLSGATLVEVPRFDVDELIRPLPAAHV